jgi:hypothetical protein
MSPSATALGESMWARILHDLAYLIHFMSDHYQRLSPFNLPRPVSWNPLLAAVLFHRSIFN